MTNRLTDIPTTEPAEIIAGDTLKWTREDLATDYPLAGYSLTYALIRTGGTPITITASEGADKYTVTVPAATTGAWTPGVYRWAAYITDTATSERAQVDSGTITVRANLASPAAGYDPRSHARRVLDAIEGVLEGRASKAHLETTLADGRSVKNIPHADLIKARQTYVAEVKREERAERLANGERPRNRLLVRM
jgi:hypothetical protein